MKPCDNLNPWKKDNFFIFTDFARSLSLLDFLQFLTEFCLSQTFYSNPGT